MTVTISPRPFNKTVRVPASKSHTIRRLLIAAFAKGVSVIEHPLDSLDARSCLAVCRALGAEIVETTERDGTGIAAWTVKGIGGRGGILADGKPLDVGNSGTSLFLALAMASLGDKSVTFTGDAQIARRGAGPLLQALRELGVNVVAAQNGCVPITVRGPWRGGNCAVECPTSQYLSALLLAAPLAPPGVVSEIEVPLLNEKPYVGMTLSYLDAQGINYKKAADFSRFTVYGGSEYAPASGPVCGDFSSAAFPACAAAVSGGSVTLLGLDPDDCQGDKAFFSMLRQMGARVEWERRCDGGWELRVAAASKLRGGADFDLNETPDMLPAAAVAAAYAEGETCLVNVEHARIKECDRIAAMKAELTKLGVDCAERPDGLVIRGGKKPRGGSVDGHGDHRVVMALAACAAGAAGEVSVSTAEAADVTYPGFLGLLA
jgi:3-phosphoshikimate 1-carboxyvinyltransferase